MLKVLFENYLFLSAAISFLLAQVLKMTLLSIKNKKFEYKRLIGSGGMPSSHSSFVVALATAALLKFGGASPYTAIAFVLAIVVTYDARGVRQEVGKHARILNEAINESSDMLENHKRIFLKEKVGHTFFEVIVGSVLGIIVPICIPVF